MVLGWVGKATASDGTSLPSHTAVAQASSTISPNNVAYQGVPGAYSEVASRKACPGYDPLPCEQFEVAFQVCRGIFALMHDSVGHGGMCLCACSGHDSLPMRATRGRYCYDAWCMRHGAVRHGA